ncbi:MAG: hypothetical protein JSW05_08195 [Candidatus Thorarchaeota archaeon]|nr:MAG: hypothetical protein JSW05_08195 [Candidatus Thorarchaeota archaeon]
MSSDEILLLAFENVAGHLANLDSIRSLVQKLTGHGHTTDKVIQMLEGKMEEAEVTLRTDLRILINEIRHVTRGKFSG